MSGKTNVTYREGADGQCELVLTCPSRSVAEHLQSFLDAGALDAILEERECCGEGCCDDEGVPLIRTPENNDVFWWPTHDIWMVWFKEGDKLRAVCIDRELGQASATAVTPEQMADHQRYMMQESDLPDCGFIYYGKFWETFAVTNRVESALDMTDDTGDSLLTFMKNPGLASLPDTFTIKEVCKALEHLNIIV